MKLNSTEEIFARNIALLSEFTPEEERMVPTGTGAFPSIEIILPLRYSPASANPFSLP